MKNSVIGIIAIIIIFISGFSNIFITLTINKLTNDEINLLKSEINLIKSNSNSDVKQEQQTDEFSLLSEEAKKELLLLDTSKGIGTPTALIDGKQYQGFCDENCAVEMSRINMSIPDGVMYPVLMINAKEILLFSSPSCPYCENLENFLISKNIEVKKRICVPIHQGDYDKCKYSKIKYIY